MSITYDFDKTLGI